MTQGSICRIGGGVGILDVRALGSGAFLLDAEGGGAPVRVAASAGGEGTVFSPVDLVAGALGACLFSVMEVMLTRWGCDAAGIRMQVEREMAEAPRRIAAFRVMLAPSFPLDAVQRKKLERAMALCPVKRSLAADVRVDIVWAGE